MPYDNMRSNLAEYPDNAAIAKYKKIMHDMLHLINDSSQLICF